LNMKYFVLVLALLGTLLLVACSSDSERNDETEPQTVIDTEEDTPESETVPETEAETVPETEPEKILVHEAILGSFKNSPAIYTPVLNTSVSLPYAKPIKTLDELTSFTESLGGTFDLNALYSETHGAFLTIYDGFSEEIKSYNSAYFNEYALIVVAVEAPGAMGYLPEVENVEYSDEKITVTVVSDPYDNIKSKVFHILITIPQDKYSENVEVVFNQHEAPAKGAPVSVPFEYKVGGQIMHDIERVGNFPQYNKTVLVFDAKEDLDKYLSERHFSGCVKNDKIGATFMDGVAKYDEKFFEEKTLIIFGQNFKYGVLPEITSVTMDSELLRIGYTYPTTAHWATNTFLYYCFIEVDKTYNVGSAAISECGVDGSFVAEFEEIPEINLSIPVFQYQIAPIIDGELKTTGISAYPVATRQQLMELVEIKSFDGNVTTDTYNKSFVDIANEYTDDFFKEKMLVLIRTRIPKNETFGINEVRLENGTINISLSYRDPQNEKTDAYYVFLELPNDCYSPVYKYYAHYS